MSELDHSQSLIEEMKRYYEARAPWHDDYMSYESPERMETLMRPIIDAISPAIAGKRVLEIGCGTGNWTRILAERAESVVAIDASAGALKIAADNLAETGNVSLRQADAYDLQSLDGSFDALFAADFWSHVPLGLIPEFVPSISAKLSEKGRACFLDMSSNRYFEREPSRVDVDGNRISRRVLPDGSAFDVVKNFPSEEDLSRILEPHARAVEFHEFNDLERWMVAFAPMGVCGFTCGKRFV